MSKIYEVKAAVFEKMLVDTARPIDFNCPRCNRTYRMRVQHLDMHVPVIACDCGYRFNRGNGESKGE